MYEGNPVDLQMEKVISADGIFDDTTRACRVYKYDIEDEYIYLELKEDELTAILLDAKYRCYISTKTELLCCSGVVKERYRSEGINLLKFRIENGSKHPVFDTRIENGFYNIYEDRRATRHI